MLTIGGTYDFVVDRLLPKESPKKLEPLGFSIPTLEILRKRAVELAEQSKGDIDPPTMLQIKSLYLAHEYGSYLISAEILSMPSIWVLSPSITAKLEAQMLRSLANLSERQGTFGSEIDRLVSRLLQSGLTRAATLAEEREAGVNSDHMPGEFSGVRPAELAPMASRAEPMVRRYGSKIIESVFEQQLALIFQSFGFLVIPTHRARRSIDLLCLSNDSPINRLIMVEAKTTKGFYSLKTSDERALKEYVETARTSLRTLPPPSLLIVVGPKPASTLESKLGKLSASARVPIRFLSANALAALREAAPGAIPSDLLINALLKEPIIIEEDFGKKVAQSLRQLQEAHQRLAHDLEAVWAGDSLSEPH